MPPPRPRRRSPWLWLWLPLGLLLLALIVVVLASTLDSVALDRQVEQRLAALRAQGYPTTLAECAPTPVPPERNAGLIYQDLLTHRFPGLPASIGVRPGDEAQARAAQSERKQYLARGDIGQALAKLRRASELPECVMTDPNWRARDPFDATDFTAVPASFRKSALLIGAQERELLGQGRTREAVDWAIVGLKHARHLRRTPLYLFQLSASACESVPLGVLWEATKDSDLSGAASDPLRAYLLTTDLRECYERVPPAEVAFQLQWFSYIDSRSKLPPLPPHWTADNAREWLFTSPVGRAQRRRDELALLSLAPGWIARERLSSWETETGSGRSTGGRRLQFAKGSPWMEIHSVVTARDLDTARLQSFALALAAKAYKHDHGSYPPTLQDLRPYVGKDLPKDPFTGKDYGYTRQGQGFRLWSDYQAGGRRYISWEAGQVGFATCIERYHTHVNRPFPRTPRCFSPVRGAGQLGRAAQAG